MSRYTYLFLGKAFCLKGGASSPATGEFSSKDTQMLISGQLVEDTELVSFDYKMRSGGVHHMIVYAKCKGLPSYDIHIGATKTVYGILHLNSNKAMSDRLCVSLRPHINEIPGYSTSTCSMFQVYVQALAIGREICIEDVQFHSRDVITQSVCRK